MLEGLRESWHELKDAEPGRRFVEHYERRQERGRSSWRRIPIIGLGLVLMFAGLFMLVAPGPGILGVLVGGGVIAQEWRTAARLMDWLEVQTRRVTDPAVRYWKRAPMPVRIALTLVSLVLAAGVAVGTFMLFA